MGRRSFSPHPGITPGPVSATEISANFPFRLVSTLTILSACFVALWRRDRLGSNGKHLLQLDGIAVDRRGAPFSLLQDDLTRPRLWRQDLIASATSLLISIGFRSIILHEAAQTPYGFNNSPVLAFYVVDNLLHLFQVWRYDFKMILAVSELFRIAPRGWLISCAICAATSPAVAERLTCASPPFVPEVHLRRMTAIPLKHKERDEPP